MASPQAENGYTRIAHEIMEALARIRVPGRAMQVLFVILRKTYGFGKKADAIALSQFNLATGIKKSNICRALKQLESMSLIIKNDNGNTVSYQFNKDYSTWKPLSKMRPIIKNDNESLSKMRHTIDNSTIDKKMGASPEGESPAPLKSKKKPTDPRIKEAIDHFSALVLEKRGFKPVITGGKDGDAIKRALNGGSMDLEGVKRVFAWYLDTEKAKKHLTISAALSADSINQYQLWWKKVKWQYGE
jgi:phage replication O-like protein O